MPPSNVELHFVPPLVSKRSAKKSKLGCQTCKLRRVKCDEKHPLCGNCKIYFSSRVDQCDFEVSPTYLGTSNDTSVESCLPAKTKTIPLARKPNPSRVLQRIVWHTAAKVPQTLGLHTLDPFDTQRKSKLPVSNHLLHHYLSTLINVCIPRGFTKETNPLAAGWWPLIQSDDLLFHAMLQVSALDLEWHKEAPNSFHSARYEGECIRLLRERLEDPISASCDQTIGAVASLACLAWSRRNMKAMRMHINGLRKMVAVRGGLEELESSHPVAATAAIWFSLILTAEVQFPLEDLPLHESPQWLDEISESSKTAGSLNFEAYGVGRTVSNLMLKIRHLSQDFPSTSDNNPCENPSGTQLHSKVNMLLARLLQTKYEDAESRVASITDCCRWAASIFLLSLFENHFPDPTRLIHSLAQRIQAGVGSILSSSAEDGNKLIAWILSVGGVAAASLPTERDWFTSHLAESVTDLQLRSWDEMKACLKSVLWIDVVDDSPYKELLGDVLVRVNRLTIREPFGDMSY